MRLRVGGDKELRDIGIFQPVVGHTELKHLVQGLIDILIGEGFASIQRQYQTLSHSPGIVVGTVLVSDVASLDDEVLNHPMEHSILEALRVD